MGLIDTENAILDRETASGSDHQTRRDELTAERAATAAELKALEAQWEEEKILAARIAAARETVEDATAAGDHAVARAELTEARAAMRVLQGERPLIFPLVDGQAIAEIVENWTGVPAGRMQSDEIRTVLNLRQSMERRVVGQSHALEAVAEAIRTSRAGSDRSA